MHALALWTELNVKQGDNDDFYNETDFDDVAQETPMTPESLGGAEGILDRDLAIDGDLPLLLLHREHYHFKHVGQAMTELHQTAAASMSLGLILNLPTRTPAQAMADIDGATKASVLIADPACYARFDQWGPKLLVERDGTRPAPPDKPPPRPLMRRQADWPYFCEPLPAGPTQTWVEKIIDAQRSVGANLILTPGLPLDSMAPAAALDSNRQHIDWATKTVDQDERLAVNITVGSEWLTNKSLRNRLLAEIVERDEDVWYIRVQWPALTSTYGQLCDVTLLDAYQELAVVCEDEDKRLLLPNSGGTGWLSLSWGATGFGTGIGSKARAFAVASLHLREESLWHRDTSNDAYSIL